MLSARIPLGPELTEGCIGEVHLEHYLRIDSVRRIAPGVLRSRFPGAYHLLSD
jgi:hypothetical protein